MSEILFYGGIVLIVISTIGAMASGIILTVYRKRLHEVLEKEYGKKHRTLH